MLVCCLACLFMNGQGLQQDAVPRLYTLFCPLGQYGSKRLIVSHAKTG